MHEDVPDNARIMSNIGNACNYLMSHILHFYHLVALDYVDVNGTGLIPKGFTCPNYDSDYYARGIDPVLQTGGLPNLGINAPAYTVNNAPVANPNLIAGALGDLTPYLAGQYVRALKMRRLSQQIGALFMGKMPHASAYTPGCLTTKAYDPDPTGADAAVVQKFHECLYGGPGFDPVGGGTFGGVAISMSTPHPESLMGFIGKPSDWWAWAADNTGPITGGGGALGTNIGFDPAFLPPWAQLGVPAADPTTTGSWKHGGTFCFDTVAAAHCFPEYFWIGSGYGRYLAWGIFEGADVMGFGDQRLITRGRVHTGTPGKPFSYSYQQFGAEHMKAKEFTTHSWYDDKKGLNFGRHMWKGKTSPNANKAGAYTFAKTPRYENSDPGAPAGFIPYEVGPLARGMNNAGGLTSPGGPATVGEVVAVNSGLAYAYYPGILVDVDATIAANAAGLGLGTGLGGSPIGIFPAVGANMTSHIVGLGVQVGPTYGPLHAGPPAVSGAPVFYLPSANALPYAALAGNLYKTDYMGGATLDRIAARTLETYFVGAQMLNWFNQIDPNQPTNKTLYYTYKTKDTRTAPRLGAKGAGLTEAPRGALGHWIKVGAPNKKNAALEKKFRGKVLNYQIITPTAWNISPMDSLGYHGPIEECIVGTPLVSGAEPIEILRVIHSFDPCCACTVHVMNPKEEEIAKVTLEALM
jgi:Ni,Fe-hydrogenase I large subunit